MPFSQIYPAIDLLSLILTMVIYLQNFYLYSFQYHAPVSPLPPKGGGKGVPDPFASRIRENGARSTVGVVKLEPSILKL